MCKRLDTPRIELATPSLQGEWLGLTTTSQASKLDFSCVILHKPLGALRILLYLVYYVRPSFKKLLNTGNKEGCLCNL